MSYNFFKVVLKKRLLLFIRFYWSQALAHVPGLGAQTCQACLGEEGCELGCMALGIHTQAGQRQFDARSAPTALCYGSGQMQSPADTRQARGPP